MFAQITIDEPLERIADDWDFFQERILPHFSTFRPHGHNVFGVRRRIVSAKGVNDPKKGNISRYLELGPHGVEESQHNPLEIKVTSAGVPHRVCHNFGYWHINDKDELYFGIPGLSETEPGHFVVIMGRPKDDETDGFAWYCEKCMTLLHEVVVETGRRGFSTFWKGEQDAVRRYNADLKLRTCVECGHVNPLGYCWNKAKDTPEEAIARTYW